MAGPVGTVLQAGYMLGVVASLPAVKSLRADIEVPAGETSIATTRLVVVKPFKSLSGFFDSSILSPARLRR